MRPPRVGRILALCVFPFLILFGSLDLIVRFAEYDWKVAEERASIAYNLAKEDILELQIRALSGLSVEQNRVIIDHQYILENRVQWKGGG